MQVLAYDVPVGRSRLISAVENKRKIEAAAKSAAPADAIGAIVTPTSDTSNDHSDAEPTSNNDTSV